MEMAQMIAPPDKSSNAASAALAIQRRPIGFLRSSLIPGIVSAVALPVESRPAHRRLACTRRARRLHHNFNEILRLRREFSSPVLPEGPGTIGL